MTRYGIVGAGIAGLSAAWELSLHGHEVVIYEATDRLGGLAAGFKDESWDWSVEKYYHHWFQTDKDLLKLADELGIRDKIFFPRPKTSIWHNDKMYQLDSPLSALKLPIISWMAKFCFGLAGAYLKYLVRNGQHLEKFTADEWLQKFMGSEAYETLWRPLLIGKFGKAYQETNMAWFWARIYARTTRLGTYQGGFQTFLEDVAAVLQQKNVTIQFNAPVQNIERPDNGKIHVTTKTETAEFDAVISTTSPALLLKLVPQIEGAYAEKVRNLRSMGAVVMVLSLKNQLMTDGTYWLNLPASTPDKSRGEFPFLALVEHTNFVDRQHFNGDYILYMGDYVSPEHEYFHLSDEELQARFIEVLPRINPNFSPDWIKKRWVFRAPYAQPLPTVNHSHNIPDLKTPVPGIYWASMSQVYPWDRGTNFAIEIGRRVAKLALNC